MSAGYNIVTSRQAKYRRTAGIAVLGWAVSVKDATPFLARVSQWLMKNEGQWVA